MKMGQRMAWVFVGLLAVAGAVDARGPGGGMAGGMADITKIKVQQARRAAYARGDAMLAEIFNQWLMRYGRP